MKFIFILYLLFVIGNRASAANYGEKPLVPGETDESDRDFPGSPMIIMMRNRPKKKRKRN